MAERELLLSPPDNGDAVALSNKLYRKRILPKATINYRGRKIKFDDAYLNDLANSYQQGAYDQVAFMLAPDNNAHTLDPERFRGEVQGVEVADDGLYATIQVTPDFAKVLQENPKLGVSARILENYERSDGKHFPRALQHVLGTLDPVITGLGNWEEVALSNGVDLANVIDLSTTSYEELEQMATRADYLKQVAEATDMTVEALEALGMTDDELAIFASAFDVEPEPADTEELVEEAGLPELEAEGDAPLPSHADIEAAVEALSDEELEQLAAELGLTDGDDTEEAAEETPEEAAETVEQPVTGTAPEETPEGAGEPVTGGTSQEPAEPTDQEIVDRLAEGRFNNGIDEPVIDPTDLDDLTDEALAAMWATAREMDEASDRLRTETAETGQDTGTGEQADGQTPATAAGSENAEAVAGTAETPELVGAGAVTLSNETSTPEMTALSQQVSVLQRQLAEQQFEAVKRDYIRQGVPAALVELARPVLIAGPSAVLEFSNSAGQPETVDAAAIVRQLLDSATGYIDLARERGHSYSPSADDLAASQADEDKRLAQMWGETYHH